MRDEIQELLGDEVAVSKEDFKAKMRVRAKQRSKFNHNIIHNDGLLLVLVARAHHPVASCSQTALTSSLNCPVPTSHQLPPSPFQRSSSHSS